jgi:hypothetical protein
MSPRLLTAAAIAALAPALASASERHFTYTYESAVLPQGAKEIELWSTWRRGKPGGTYAAMDNRAEFEVGVTDTFQVAMYLNFERETVENPVTGELESDSQFEGFSLELKKKLADAVADPIGFAVYAELGVAADEAELELKAIADKQVGDHLFAINATWEPEVELEADGNEIGQHFEGVLAYDYFISPTFAIGLEARNDNIVTEDDGWRSSALFVGPAVHWSYGDWWITGTWLPQVAAIKGETGDSGLVLDDHERYEIRIISGITF